MALTFGVGESLCNRVILDFLFLDPLGSDLLVGLGDTLEVLLSGGVLIDVLSPRAVAISEAVDFAGFCKSVTVTNFHLSL